MLPGKRYTPDDLLRLVLRRKWIILLPTLLTTAGMVTALRYVPDTYRSSTLILVVPQRVPDSYVRSTVTARIEDRLQAISQQILSRSRLEPIITELNLYPKERAVQPMEDVVDKMRRDIRVETIRGDAFRVSYVSHNPDFAQKVTERLASLFIEENLRDREVLADATNQFLDSQLKEARERLVQHEKRLEAYRLRYAGELPNQLQSNLQSMQALQTQVQGLTDSVARDRDRRMILERQLGELRRQDQSASAAARAAGTSVRGSEDAPPQSARRQLEEARRGLEQLLMRLTPEHPDVVRAKRAIADLEIKAAEEQKALAAAARASDGVAVDPAASEAERAIAELRLELAALNKEIADKEAKLAALHSEVDEYRSRVDAIPTRETEMVELMRDYDTLRAVYTDLLAKRENSKVAANLERRQIGEQFRVLDPARRPERPFSPNRPYFTALATGAGLLIGLAIVALLELRDNTFHRDDDVMQALGLPVLAMVPRMLSTDERRQQRIRSWAVSGAALAGVAGVAVLVVYGIWR